MFNSDNADWQGGFDNNLIVVYRRHFFIKRRHLPDLPCITFSLDELKGCMISDIRSNYPNFPLDICQNIKFPCPLVFLFPKSAKMYSIFPISVKK